MKDALFGLRELTPNPIKNKTEINNASSGFSKEKIKKYLSNKYLKLINERKPAYIYNHKARYNNQRDIEIFSRLPQGGDSTHYSITDIMPYKTRKHIFKDKFFKLQEDKVCKTITSHMKQDCHMYIHPNQARGLSPREAARVQSFPDSYYFCGPLTKNYLQIGNSVPPLLSIKLCQAIESLSE